MVSDVDIIRGVEEVIEVLWYVQWVLNNSYPSLLFWFLRGWVSDVVIQNFLVIFNSGKMLVQLSLLRIRMVVHFPGEQRFPEVVCRSFLLKRILWLLCQFFDANNSIFQQVEDSYFGCVEIVVWSPWWQKYVHLLLVYVMWSNQRCLSCDLFLLVSQGYQCEGKGCNGWLCFELSLTFERNCWLENFTVCGFVNCFFFRICVKIKGCIYDLDNFKFFVVWQVWFIGLVYQQFCSWDFLIRVTCDDVMEMFSKIS